mmetsp:Transcript_25864/g.85208  ORF Transcript_25864/g.85208 Transcript_25864/m.85208 type:complete len:225 (+) Transcript_25864:634-1308(+)
MRRPRIPQAASVVAEELSARAYPRHTARPTARQALSGGGRLRVTPRVARPARAAAAGPCRPPPRRAVRRRRTRCRRAPREASLIGRAWLVFPAQTAVAKSACAKGRCVSLEGTSCEPSSARLHAAQWLAALQRRTSADKHSGRRDARVCSCRAEGVRGRVGGGGGEACGGASGAQRGTSAPGRSSRSSRAAESDRGRRGGPLGRKHPHGGAGHVSVRKALNPTS